MKKITLLAIIVLFLAFFIIPNSKAFDWEQIYAGSTPKEKPYKTTYNYSLIIYESSDYNSINVFLNNASYFLTLKNCTTNYLYSYCIGQSFDENKPLKCPAYKTTPNDAVFCYFDNCQEKGQFRVCINNVTVYDYNWSKPDIDRKATYTIYWAYGINVFSQGAILNITRIFPGKNKVNINDELMFKTSIENYGSKEAYDVFFKDAFPKFEVLTSTGCFFENDYVYWIGNISPNQRIDCRYTLSPKIPGEITNNPYVNWTDNTTGRNIKKSYINKTGVKYTIEDFIFVYFAKYKSNTTKDGILNVAINLSSDSAVNVESFDILPVSNTEIINSSISSMFYNSEDKEWKKNTIDSEKLLMMDNGILRWKNTIDEEKKVDISLTLKIKNSGQVNFLNISALFLQNNIRSYNNKSFSINSSISNLILEPIKKSAVTKEDLENYQIRIYNPTTYTFFNLTTKIIFNGSIDTENSKLEVAIPRMISNTNQLVNLSVRLVGNISKNITFNLTVNYSSDVSQRYYLNKKFVINLSNTSFTSGQGLNQTTNNGDEQNVSSNKTISTTEKIFENLINENNFPIIIPSAILIVVIICLIIFLRYRKKAEQ